MKFFDHLEGLFTARVNIVKGMWSLVKLETTLARATLIPFLINIAILVALILTVWLTTMVIIGFVITNFATQGNLLAGMGGVLLINIVLFIYILKRLSTNIQHLSFEKTRACLASNHSRDSYESEEKVTGINSQNAKGNSLSTNDAMLS